MCELPLFCITGTDTDIGKSVVTAGLLKAFAQRGLPVRGIKAIQTGCAFKENGIISPDADLYMNACPECESLALERLVLPCSPHLAARREGRRLSLRPLVKRILAITRQQAKITLIEGAGGLYVPLNNEECIIDLFQAVNAPVILVAPNRLGTVNQVLLNLDVLRSRNIPVAGVVLNTTRPLDKSDSLAADISRDNADIISRIGNVPIPLCLPYLPALRQNPEYPGQSVWEFLAETFSSFAENLLSFRTFAKKSSPLG